MTTTNTTTDDLYEFIETVRAARIPLPRGFLLPLEGISCEAGWETASLRELISETWDTPSKKDPNKVRPTSLSPLRRR